MTIASFGWSRHLIANSGADAEQQLVAALLAGARESCANGNTDDCQWLASCGAAYLSLVCPEYVNEQDILKRLLADLPVTPEVAEGWRESAATFTQMLLSIPPEQEAPNGNGRDLPEVRARTRALSRGDPLRRVEAATLPNLSISP